VLKEPLETKIGVQIRGLLVTGPYLVRESYFWLKGLEELKHISVEKALCFEEEGSFDVFVRYQMLWNWNPIAAYVEILKL